MINLRRPNHLPGSIRAQSSIFPGRVYFLVLSLIWAGLSSQLFAESEPINGSSSDQSVEQLIAEVGHTDFRRREQATDLLKQVSLENLPLLEQAVLNGRMEIKLRILSVLDYWYQQRFTKWQQDRALYKPARRRGSSGKRGLPPAFAEHPVRTARLQQTRDEFALLDDLFLRLRSSGNASVAQRTRETLALGKRLREFRAMIAVLDWNGKISAHNDHSGPRSLPLSKEQLEWGEIDTTKIDVILDETWKRGRRGVELLKRLQNMDALYLIDGAILTRAEQGEIQASIPRLRIQLRGRARLGIQNGQRFDNIKGAIVGEVQMNSSAQKAGIRQGDVIIRLNTKVIESFDVLVDELANYKPGETIEIQLIRNMEPMILPVKLFGW